MMRFGPALTTTTTRLQRLDVSFEMEVYLENRYHQFTPRDVVASLRAIADDIESGNDDYGSVIVAGTLAGGWQFEEEA